METAALILSIVCTAVGATWVLSTHLSSIQTLLASVVEQVKQHEADIIELKGRSKRRR